MTLRTESDKLYREPGLGIDNTLLEPGAMISLYHNTYEGFWIHTLASDSSLFAVVVGANGRNALPQVRNRRQYLSTQSLGDGSSSKMDPWRGGC